MVVTDHRSHLGLNATKSYVDQHCIIKTPGDRGGIENKAIPLVNIGTYSMLSVVQ